VPDDDDPSQSWPSRVGLAGQNYAECRASDDFNCSGRIQVRVTRGSTGDLGVSRAPDYAVHGGAAAKELDLVGASPGVIVIGHRAPREEREDLVRHFRSIFANVPILALIGRDDSALVGVDYNCPADEPQLWIRTVQMALAGIS